MKLSIRSRERHGGKARMSLLSGTRSQLGVPGTRRVLLGDNEGSCTRDDIVSDARSLTGDSEVRVGTESANIVFQSFTKYRGATLLDVAGKHRYSQASAFAKTIRRDVGVELGTNGVRSESSHFDESRVEYIEKNNYAVKGCFFFFQAFLLVVRSVMLKCDAGDVRRKK